MVTLNIKALSVNECWQGKRFKTKRYLIYETILIRMLPDIVLPSPPYELNLKFGFSSASSDWDNPIKPFVDILQKRYGFNDKLIKRAVVEVEKVKKGDEFIEFNLGLYS